MANVVLGVFSEKEYAEEVIFRLEDRGYNPKEMSILMKDRRYSEEMAEHTGAESIAVSTAAGVGTGAAVGGLAGLIAAAFIPGLGGFFIGGPIGAALGLTGAAATAVSGAVTGAAAGGLIGALVSAFNLSNEQAKIYERKINEGGILVAVPAREDDEDEVKSLMEEFHADNIKVVEADATRERRRYEDMEEDRPRSFFQQITGRRRSRR